MTRKSKRRRGTERAGAGVDEDQGAEEPGAEVFATVREEPGNVSVRTIEREMFKLGAIKAAGLPGDLFDDVAPAVQAAWRARVAAEAPSHLREHPRNTSGADASRYSAACSLSGLYLLVHRVRAFAPAPLAASPSGYSAAGLRGLVRATFRDEGSDARAQVTDRRGGWHVTAPSQPPRASAMPCLAV